MTKKATGVGGLVAGHQHNAAHDDGIDNLACDLHPVTGNLLYLAKELVSNDYSTFFRRMIDVAHADRNLADDPVLSLYVEADEAVLALLDHLLTALEVRAEKFDEQIKSKASGRRSLVMYTHVSMLPGVCVASLTFAFVAVSPMGLSHGSLPWVSPVFSCRR